MDSALAAEVLPRLADRLRRAPHVAVTASRRSPSVNSTIDQVDQNSPDNRFDMLLALGLPRSICRAGKIKSVPWSKLDHFGEMILPIMNRLGLLSAKRKRPLS
jgi:hypothetical protein